MSDTKTVEQLEAILEQWEEIQRLAAPIARMKAQIKYGKDYYFDHDDIVYEDGCLTAQWREYDRWDRSYYDEFEVYIPLDDLTNENFIAEAEEEIRVKKEKAKEEERLEREQRAKERAEKKLEKDLKEYARLQAQFGDRDE